MAEKGGSGRSWFVLPFLPAIAVMNRLTFARKFILIGLLLSVPLAALVFLQASVATERIEFNVHERIGVEYLGPACEFLHQVQWHRVLSCAVAAGNPQFADELAQVGMRAEAASRLEAVDARHDELLRTSQGWRAIRQSWEHLLTRRFEDAGDGDAAHGLISAALVDLIVHHVGNYSNLILDPDLDSYWLMDALVNKLPALAEAVSRATSISLRWPGRSPGGAGSIIELVGDLREEQGIASDLERVSLATAFRETAHFGNRPGLRQSLEPSLAAAEQAVQKHVEWLRHLVESDSPASVPASDQVASTREALTALYRLQRQVGPELDQLIASRLARYRGQRVQGFVAAGAVAAVLCYLFIAIYLSVRSSVSSVRGEDPAKRSRVLAPASRDELGQIAVAFSHAQSEKSKLEEQLRLADRLATIGTLAAGTAHEINEPLGAILGFAQLAMKVSNLPESTERDLGKITAAALHAREVIKKLMLFARQMPLEKAPTDLRQVIQEALEFLQPRCQQAGITVIRELDAAVPKILADGGQLRQVVLNLMVNAIQASSAGGRVTVSLRGAGGQVHLAVADEGRGMDEDLQQRIFLPFFTTKQVGEGTGLGLSVVHGIVVAHGGTIGVESAPGKGTRFEVVLPIGSDDDRT